MNTDNSFLVREDIAACTNILTDRGPTYETAIRFFPQWMAERVAVLYAFVRVPDDIVDETPDPLKATRDLADWKADWSRAVQLPAEASNPVLRANAQLFAKTSMPEAYWSAFFTAMQWDLTKKQYDDMNELKEYMYGSACVVGLMMLQIMPQREPYDEATKQQAMALGYAMQLTNFLRDIAEDWHDRQRVYLPQDILHKHGITEADFDAHRYTDGWTTMMKELIAQCRTWYAEAAPGIKKLPKKLQHAVRVSSALYQTYLDMIEKSDYRVWENRYTMTKWQKMRIALRVWLFNR